MNRAPRFARRNVGHQGIAILNRFSVHSGDDVARLQPGLVGWSLRRYLVYQNSALEAVNALYRRIQAGLELDPDRAPDHLVLRPNQIVVNPNDGIGRHGKADALITRGLRQNRSIDPDDLVGHVDQRTPGVARVDRRICLNEMLKLAGRTLFNGTVLGRADPGRNRLRSAN